MKSPKDNQINSLSYPTQSEHEIFLTAGLVDTTIKSTDRDHLHSGDKGNNPEDMNTNLGEKYIP